MPLTRFVLAASVAVLALAGIPSAAAQIPPDGGTRFQPFTTVWAGVYGKEEAGRGRRAAADLCGRCHGDTLAGGTAPGLVKSQFFDRWHDLRLADVVVYIQSAMPHGHDFFVPPEKARDIVAFILQESGVAPGAAPMSSDVQKLSGILITLPPAARASDVPAR
jgi:hypothetical protein